MYRPSLLAPGVFAQPAAGYRQVHNISKGDLKRAMAYISVKSYTNEAKNPKAHLQKEVDMETVLNAPMISESVGLFDCCGVSDGAAAAIVTTLTIAKHWGQRQLKLL